MRRLGSKRKPNPVIVVASPAAVKAYVACWLQLGKSIDSPLPARSHHLESSVLSLSALSGDFEQLWNDILERAADCYLSGTEQSIADLLSDRWEIVDCARCGMHVPIPECQPSTNPCPCADMAGLWPNAETLPPRLHAGMVDPTAAKLKVIINRLKAFSRV